MKKLDALFLLLSLPGIALAGSKDGNEVGNRLDNEKNQHLNCLKGLIGELSIFNEDSIEPYEKQMVSGILKIKGKEHAYIIDNKNKVFLIPFPEKAQAQTVVAGENPYWKPNKSLWKKNGEPKENGEVHDLNFALTTINDKEVLLRFMFVRPYKDLPFPQVNIRDYLIFPEILDSGGLAKIKSTGKVSVDKVVNGRSNVERVTPTKINLSDFQAQNASSVFNQILTENLIPNWQKRLDSDKQFNNCEYEFEKFNWITKTTGAYNSANSCLGMLTDSSSKKTLEDFVKNLQGYAKENNLVYENNKFVSKTKCKDEVTKESIDESGRGAFFKDPIPSIPSTQETDKKTISK